MNHRSAQTTIQEVNFIASPAAVSWVMRRVGAALHLGQADMATSDGEHNVEHIYVMEINGLVGGLEHDWIIFPYIRNCHRNWLIYTRGVAQPPTSGSKIKWSSKKGTWNTHIFYAMDYVIRSWKTME